MRAATITGHKITVTALDFQDRYLQRDIPAIRSQVIVGDAYTTGETFDSVNVRGMRLYSDSRMLPSALASYAPIIRGVANSNAKVTVTQNVTKSMSSPFHRVNS